MDDKDVSDIEEPIKPPQNPFPDTHEGLVHYTVMSGVQTVVSIAILMATILTLWNPRKMFRRSELSELIIRGYDKLSSDEMAEDNPSIIGLLAGYWQDSSGEVCTDGLVESEINYDIVTRVAENLSQAGYQVKIFPEYDLELLNFKGNALVAIYSGSCAEEPSPPSGFKVGTSLTAQNLDVVNRLAVCVSEEYQKTTNLAFQYEVVNPDHPSYHIFRDIHPETPAVRFEIGSLKSDRELVMGQPDLVAEGITFGILCFLNLEN